MIERAAVPGGRAGHIELDGYRFDTGPSTLGDPEALTAAFTAVGEEMSNWVDLVKLTPAYRAHFADGSTLDVDEDPDRMAAAIREFCGTRDADGYLRFTAAGSPADRANQFFADRRTRRLFGRSLFAGLAPSLYHPRGGLYAVPGAMADVAAKHGVTMRYDTTVTGVESRGDRVTAVLTADGERLAADAFVLPVREAPQPPPSCVVMHLGARARFTHAAHHSVYFGHAWERSFTEIVDRGELMTDPSLLVTNPTSTDNTVAPPGRDTYYVLAPVPNLKTAPVNWTTAMGRRYAGELMAALEARGYLDLGINLEVSHVVTPADWNRDGLPAGSPFCGPAPTGHANAYAAGGWTVRAAVVSGHTAARSVLGGHL